jgi:Transposase/DDE superfamily endonuclease
MAPTTPPLDDWNHIKGFEIATKHKEAMRQLHWFGKVPICMLQRRYKDPSGKPLGESTIRKILGYAAPERARPSRKGPKFLLSDEKVDEVIIYAAQTWETRIMNWGKLREELGLRCSIDTLKRRMHQRGYYRCVACQKPYLTLAQVTARFLWAIAHMFWTVEWLKVLWSDEVTFLIGGKTVKQKVTRNVNKGCSERFCDTCIQHQLHRGHTTPVNAWGAIGFGYKSPLYFIDGHGKNDAFLQTDYLQQVLEPYIQGILEAFALVTHTLHPSAEPLFMEDGNAAHGHKSTTNCCARFRTRHGIILMPHPSTSPDMNPIEKCWRWIKQALHRRPHQPTTVAEMRQAVREEWDAIPQDWINQLILKQEHWVTVLMKRHGWSTPN